ncbi:hypothetical protein JCM31598_00820 [Desulfonatronum parangueonense]
MKRLHDELVKPIATEATRGAWYRSWRVVSIDGSCMDVADESVNAEEFGRPACKMRVVAGNRNVRSGCSPAGLTLTA